jgi:integrase
LFSVIVKKYMAENQRSRRAADQVRVELEKFQNIIGGDRPIASITKNEGRTYKEHLINDRKVSLATVAKHLHTLSGLFTWADKQGYMNDGAPNPVKGLAPSKTEGEKGAVEIRPFTDAELMGVFSSTNFLKQKATRPDRYWIALLCLYQLCRREEAAQLALTDLGEKDRLPCITITDLGEGQSVKNRGSKRTMPVHSSLITLGFLDYVRDVRAERHACLFHQLPRQANGYSDAIGKWFAQHLDKVGLSQPELVMHSLRHGIHYLHALGCPQDVAEMLTGHSATSVHDKVYAHRNLTPLTRLRDGLEKMQFPDVLKALVNGVESGLTMM